MGKTYRRFAYRKIDGIIGGVVNNLGIKDHDLAKSLKKELTKTILTQPGLSVGTDFTGGYVSDRYRNGCNDFAPQKKEKLKH